MRMRIVWVRHQAQTPVALLRPESAALPDNCELYRVFTTMP